MVRRIVSAALLAALLAVGMAACGGQKGEPSAYELGSGVTLEQLVEETAQKYEMPESVVLNGADLAALLGLREKTVAEGCGRIAVAQDAPEQLLVLRAAAGEAKTVAAALQKRLQSQQQAFAAFPAQGDKAAAGRVVAAGDYCLLFILDWPEEGSADAIEQDLLGYFVASA